MGSLSELLPGSIQVTFWWLPLSYCHGNGEAMISAHGPKLLATKRCTRVQTLRSKALTWKETTMPACSPSAAVLRALFSSITHSVLTQQSDLVSTFILPRQMRSALNLLFTLLSTFVVLCPSFSLSSSLFTLHDQVCTQSAMWSPSGIAQWH